MPSPMATGMTGGGLPGHRRCPGTCRRAL